MIAMMVISCKLLTLAISSRKKAAVTLDSAADMQTALNLAEST